jgi:hypothetical protein
VLFAGHVILHDNLLRHTQYAQQDGGGETGAILAGAAVPHDGFAVGLLHRVHELAELWREGGGELAVGVQHQRIGIEAVEVAGLDARHDLAHHGLVAVIQRWNLYDLEPGRLGQAIGLRFLFGGGAKVDQGFQPQFVDSLQISVGAVGERGGAVEYAPLHLPAIGRGIAAQVAEIGDALEVEQAVGVALFRRQDGGYDQWRRGNELDCRDDQRCGGQR